VDPSIVHPLDQIGLHRGNAGGGTTRERTRKGKSNAFMIIHGRALTCSMISVPLMPPLSQYVVRRSEKHTHVYVTDYFLCGTSGCGATVVLRT
jgi:hypothetical protein